MNLKPVRHTPLPWVEKNSYIFDQGGSLICECISQTDAKRKANSRFISLAVNSHDDLLEACKVIYCEYNHKLSRKTSDVLMNAIQKAEGWEK